MKPSPPITRIRIQDWMNNSAEAALNSTFEVRNTPGTSNIQMHTDSLCLIPATSRVVFSSQLPCSPSTNHNHFSAKYRFVSTGPTPREPSITDHSTRLATSQPRNAIVYAPVERYQSRATTVPRGNRMESNGCRELDRLVQLRARGAFGVDRHVCLVLCP